VHGVEEQALAVEALRRERGERGPALAPRIGAAERETPQERDGVVQVARDGRRLALEDGA
jgi:hypothetical protein